VNELPTTKDLEQALGHLIFANGSSMLPHETIGPLADRFRLSQELRSARKTSDGRLIWDNRVHWARLSLANKGIIAKHIRGRWALTDDGMNLFEFRKSGDFLITANNAIDDLNQEPSGNEFPDRKRFIGSSFSRDSRVRNEVLKRSNGNCEYCSVRGFTKPDGSHYLETHHIISLAEQGPDTLDNVIALCPNHHREAHFGEGWEQLEAEFKIKLAKLRGKQNVH
jgi:Mrr N-terminal domain/HNH endonuclease